MGNIEHSEPIRLYRYGNQWTTAAPGLDNYATPANETAEFVRAAQLRGAVEALREWLDADREAERDYTDATEARLAAAIQRAHNIVGGQCAAHPRKEQEVFAVRHREKCPHAKPCPRDKVDNVQTQIAPV